MPGKEPPRAGPTLVTGGAGFIGARLVRLLLDREPEGRVVTLDALTYAADPSRLGPALSNPRHTLVEGDVRDGDLLRDLLARHGIRRIFHLAAESHVDRSIAEPATFVSTNVLGTQSILDAARRHWEDGPSGQSPPLFVHVSTDEVFGSLSDDAPPFHPGSPYRPSSPYSASKAGADHLVMAAWRTWGFPALLTHSGNNYGPGQHGEKFIPTVLRSCANTVPIPIYGTGRNTRDWIHVDDHARALLALARSGTSGERYLIGARCERSNLDVAGEICAAMDQLVPDCAPHGRLIRHVADRPGHDWRYAVDPSVTEKATGWRATENMGETLRSLVAQALERTR